MDKDMAGTSCCHQVKIIRDQVQLSGYHLIAPVTTSARIGWV